MPGVKERMNSRYAYPSKQSIVFALDCDILSENEATGIATYVLNLLAQFVRIDSPHTFYIFVRRPSYELRQLASTESRVRLVSPVGPGWFWKAFGSAFLSRRCGADLLFVPAHRVPLIRLVPTVAVIHDLGFEVFPETFRTSDRRRISWATRMAVRNADNLIAVSESTKRDLINIYKCKPERIHVTHLGYDRQIFEPSPVGAETNISALEKYGLQKPFFLHVGVLQPRKNIIRLIDAFAQYIREERVSDVQLAIVGKLGWKYEEILERANAPDVREQVVMTGAVQSQDLPIVYKSALALMMPSLYEGFGLPILEAMACGTPVACSRSSSLTEVAGEAALLFDPCSIEEIASTMRRLSREPALRAQMISMGLCRVKYFSWEDTARETLDVLCATAEGDRKQMSFPIM